MTLPRVLLVASLLLLVAPPARADDLADEADLQFQLGAEAFQKRDYKGALEHFLLSNRLVPNQNVIFNVAYTYEQLKLYPDAYRWFTQALAQEKDPAQRKQIEAALKRVEPFVAVLEVVTTPPGATLYVDRKDLGPRGSSPRVLAFKPGTYKVLAELEGYEPRWSEPVEAKQGSHTRVELSLKQILGRLAVVGAPIGAEVRIDGAAACALPCERPLPPGRHAVEVAALGYRSQPFSPEVVAEQTATVTAALEVVRGALVVDADQRGAAVEIDGQLAGFAPAVLTPPVGERKVRVTAYGYRPYERTVRVTAEGQARVEAELIAVEEVSAASRTAQSVEDAPSSVSIVSGEELRAMSYPTIAEALRGVRGVFINDDRTYTSVGMRGFGPAGSYGNRVLILQDGHITNDDWINSSYSGFDARSSLFDVERIEVVRGPGSVLYGTGAFTGVINLVTRGKGAPDRLEAGLSAYDFGTQVAHAGAQHSWGEAGVSATAAAAHSTGRDFYFPEVAAEGRDGNARGSDGMESVSGGLKAWWQALTLEAHYALRDKVAPTGEYETYLGDPRSHYVDGRGFAELRFEPRLAETLRLFSRVYLDRYTYDSYLFGTEEAGAEREETYRGAWAGAEARAEWTPLASVRLQLGGEGQYHFQVQQTGEEHVGDPTRSSYLDQPNPFEVGAVYGNADLRPVERLHLSLGARLDAYSTFGSSLNPRVAVIGQPYERGTLKLMAGRAFRAPSIYELYYNDGGLTQVAACTRDSCSLKPETVSSGEIELTHHFSDAWSLTGSAYTNYINDLIVLRSSAANESVSQYQNTQVPVLTLGAEAELRREWRQGWTFSASYAYQHSRYLQDATVPAEQRLRRVPNSPEHIGALRGGVPLAGRALRAFTRLTAESGRYDVHDAAGDPPQGRTAPSLLWDVGLAGELPEWHLTYSAGFYNLADTRYTVPVSTEFAPITRVEQNGRTLFTSVSVTF